ncbi:peptide deformylase [Paraglaciecola aquimarina]|uniref:Peptide deformylase n=1 Tax=Paraglaciecola algarum TaxID=3050085 RepID=A0ABS9D6K6_9ALTE|nr:peptide deformylase [Paraglaciecola sp. G1-23]MCF2948319.1 peptide deformylase [Paraglaciecola sp. G1-23]
MKIAQVGEDILKTPALPVEKYVFAQIEFQDFLDELLRCMLDANGIGIAAPQVFDPRAIMIIASKSNPRYPDAPDMKPEILINPSITDHSADTCWHWEGCLSVPGLRGNIERNNWVEVDYLNRKGQSKHVRYEGFLARIFLHEFDHLIGKTWLDRVADPSHIMANDVWMEKFV